MIQELYHPRFADDIQFLLKTLGERKLRDCLSQIDKTIESILKQPTAGPKLKYTPLEEYHKRKFFSILRPQDRQRPDMRIIYRYNEAKNILYILSVGQRIAAKPQHPNDIYQRSKRRNLRRWG